MDKLKNKIQENIHKMDVDEPNAAAWDRLKKLLSNSLESDPLKTQIAENKNQLEVETPNAQSWEEISRLISAKKPAPVRRIKRSLIYLSAACIITIICFGVLRYLSAVKTNQGKEVVKTTPLKNTIAPNDTTEFESNKKDLTGIQTLPYQSTKPKAEHKSITVASLKPEKKQKKESLPRVVAQIEKDYDQLIAGQIAYTKSLAVYGENASYFQEFMNDFKTLEKQEKELRKSIVENGLQENNINDLAMIYQQKLTVLKKLQNEINKTSNRNKNLTDTIPTYVNL